MEQIGYKDIGVAITCALDSKNSYMVSRTFTVTAKDGKTAKDFTITVKKITAEDRTCKIAAENIVGGTITADPDPAAKDEEVKLTIKPDDGWWPDL